MCNVVYLSTTSTEDLALRNTDFVRFSKDPEKMKWMTTEQSKYLGFPQKWFVGSKTGCSCTFRYLMPECVELGFGEPEDWFPESADSIQGTLQVISIIRELVAKEEQVDCVDFLSGGSNEVVPLAGETEVNLRKIRDQDFRFFENYRFIFSSKI
jgi:hypothetical protein